MWIIFALLAAVTASFVALFGKWGLQKIDPTLGTTLRAVIMAAFLLSISLLLGTFKNFSVSDLQSKEWMFLIFSGVFGALSWLFYFIALKLGPVQGVAALDRLSIVFVVILAAVFLGEGFGFIKIAGVTLMAAGAILLAL